MNEAWPLGRDERYEACDDEGVLRGKFVRIVRSVPNFAPKRVFAYFLHGQKVGLRSK